MTKEGTDLWIKRLIRVGGGGLKAVYLRRYPSESPFFSQRGRCGGEGGGRGVILMNVQAGNIMSNRSKCSSKYAESRFV